MQVRFTVTDADTAQVDGVTIHRVLGTVALARRVESLGRRLLEPHLEEGEEGIGYQLTVTHHAPAPVGSELVARAVVTAADADRLVCGVTVTREEAVVATAWFEQRVLRGTSGARSGSPAAG